MGRKVSTRQKVIELGQQKVPVSEISKRLGVKYQYVRNILLSAGIELVKVRDTSENKSAKIRELLNQGMTPYQAAKSLGLPPQYGYNVARRMRQKKGEA